MLALCGLTVNTSSAFAQASSRFALEIEGGGLWLTRYDIQIPNNETATEFSLVDAVGNGPYGVLRASADVDFNERHGLRFTVAPLQIDDGEYSRPMSVSQARPSRPVQ